MEKSFFRKMINEKNLLGEVIVTATDSHSIVMDVSQLLDYIECAPEKQQQVMMSVFSEIDLMNGDLMDYLKFLAQSLAKSQSYRIYGCTYKHS